MPAAPEVNGFAALGARAETVAALDAMGITSPFPIQHMTLQIAMGGHDLIGQARTGTGKTLGFGVPLLERVHNAAEGGDGLPQALVVVPTRELCVQVAGDLENAGKTRKVRVQSIYGGRAFEPQVESLRKGVDVVVGTPGRLLDLARQGHLDLGSVKVLVLDEADEMLDLGFLPDVERILEQIPPERQTMLFSATMPGPVVTLARKFMRQPTHIRAEEANEKRTVPDTKIFVYRAHAMDKVEVLARLLQAEGRGLTMVFCRTKRTCDKVALELEDRGFAAAAVHGDLGQGAREQALRAFRSGKIDVLVATDVAARGIDVQDVTHVVNYQCPDDESTFLHRIGRTGRAGAKGVAVTFVDWDDMPKWKLINDALELPYPEPVETYSSSKHLFEDLSIPSGTTGRLPRSSRTRAGLDAEAVEDLGETGRRNKPRTGGPAGRDGGRDSGRDSGRSRGGRSGARDEPRGGDAGGDAGGDDAPQLPKRSGGARRRTRGGGGEGTAAEAGTSTTTSSGASSSTAAGTTTRAGSGNPSGEAGEGDDARRRRRRGGRGRGGSSGAAGGESGGTDAPTAD
ncbi:MAG: DEAD/DEAH box helicase [Mycobacteriales bacterium]|nr:DEAD/DEAH box helicase [Mycobacteriales bacterium]